MTKMRPITLTLFLLIAAIFLMAAGCTKQSSSSSNSIDTAVLASHLTDVGAKMYGAFWCSACASQKKLFGDDWQYAPYVECSLSDGKETEACQAEKIEAFPTWIFPDGSRHVGVLSLEELAKLSGFKSSPPVSAGSS